jgi:hypothetical protein
MTEAEWLAAIDLEKMLKFLRGRRSDRKLRLFAVAFCRGVRHLIADPRSRRAVEVAEQFAEALAPPGTVEAAAEGALDAYRQAEAACDAAEDSARRSRWDSNRRASVVEGRSAAYAASVVLNGSAAYAARQAAHMVTARGGWKVSSGALPAACQLIREVFGNPFRAAPTIAAPILSWNGSTAHKLAAAVYEERAFDRLPVLADALEDAGCTDAAVLGHCRAGGEHVRGCWVVDLVLGKG